METVYEYYSSLDKIYELFIDKAEVKKQRTLVRAYVIDNYYLQLEAQIAQYQERARILVNNPDKLSEEELIHDVREFFMKKFFNNLHFFLSILFKESQSILKIVEGVANMAVRYQIYYDDYKVLDKDIQSYCSQPTDEKTKLLFTLSEQVEKLLKEFKQKHLVNIEVNPKDKKESSSKKGFLGLFGNKDTKTGSGDKPEETGQLLHGLYLTNQQPWNFITSKEEIFFVDTQTKRKKWLQASNELKSKDLLKKELLDFSLHQNLLNQAVYEATFERFNNKVNSSEETSLKLQNFFSLIDEVLRNMLLLEKRKTLAKRELKENIHSEPEVLVSKVNEIEMVKEGYAQLVSRIEKSSDSSVDKIFKILRSFVDEFGQIANKDLGEYQSIRADCEKEIIKDQKMIIDGEAVKRILEGGFAKFGTEMKSEMQIIRLNFFSLYDPDIDQIEVNFNKCFQGADRMTLNSMKSDKTFRDDSKLQGLLVDYEEIDYFLKKFLSSMKKISINQLTIFSNMRFGSGNFLTEDQGSKNESEVFLSNLKDNRETSNLMVQVLKQKNTGSNELVTNLKQYFLVLFQLILDLTNYLLMLYEQLYQQWFTINKEFKRLAKEKDVGFWYKNLSKFQAASVDETLMSSILVNREEFVDLNLFVEEIYGRFILSFKKGIKILNLKEECSQIMVAFLSDFGAKHNNPSLISEPLSKVLNELDKKDREFSQLDREIKEYSFNEGYLFVVGDSVKKVSLREGAVSITVVVSNLKTWLQGAITVIQAWKNKSKTTQALTKEARQLESNKLSKWFSAKKCQDQLINYINNI